MTLKNKSVIVTGGAGFIGSHLVDQIIEQKPEKIMVLDNFFLGNMKNLTQAKKKIPSLEILNKDITDFKALKKILGNNSFDAVFNLAIVPLPASLEKPEWTYQQNAKMTLNLCELMRDGYFSTLVQCSSSEVYGSALYVPMDESHPLRTRTPYAASKAASDCLAISYYETFGLDITIPRPFNNYGPRQNEDNYAGVVPITIRRILNKEAPIIYGDGNQTRDYIFVMDTAKAIIDIYLSKNTRGKVINIASNKEISIKNLINLIRKLMNYEVEAKYEPERPGDVRRHKADISLAKKIINFRPQTDLEEGLKRTISYFRQK